MSDDNTDEQIGEETVETGAPDTSESKKDSRSKMLEKDSQIFKDSHAGDRGTFQGAVRVPEPNCILQGLQGRVLQV